MHEKYVVYLAVIVLLWFTARQFAPGKKQVVGSPNQP
jgi:hypothetical protein